MFCLLGFRYVYSFAGSFGCGFGLAFELDFVSRGRFDFASFACACGYHSYGLAHH